MSDLTLFHTAQVHVDTFERLAPKAELTHVVRPDWLARAQNGIDAGLEAEIIKAIAAAPSPVLCSCTSVGEVAEVAGATRIDWPMMQEAARIGGPVLMAYCVESTVIPSRALLLRAFGETDPQLELLDLSRHWPLFEVEDTLGFTRALAASIMTKLENSTFGCIILAQASMAAVAEVVQQRSAVPVLASPKIAVRELLGV